MAPSVTKMPPPLTMRTAISAGELLQAVLNDSVGNYVTRIFPVIAEAKAELPYICFKRDGLSKTTAKMEGGATSSAYAVEIFAKTYAESVDLAELVVQSIHHHKASVKLGDGSILIARSINLTGASEGWADDAYYQQLMFDINVDPK